MNIDTGVICFLKLSDSGLKTTAPEDLGLDMRTFIAAKY